MNEEEITYADDGHKETLETVKTPMFDSMGNITGVLGIARDITPRKQAAIELQASEEKFAKAFNNAPLLMTISALEDGCYLDVNEAFVRFTGYTRQTAIGSTSVEIGFISMECRDKLKQELARKHYIHEMELKLTRADGSLMYCLYSGEIITIAGRQRLLSLAMDITERKNMEERLQHAQKMEAIGNLAGGIAHDFNNILSPIVGMSELLLEDLQEGSREYENTREILTAGMRGSELVRQILTFSRQAEHQIIPVRLQQILKEVLKLSRASIPRDIEIRTKIDQACRAVNADPTRIHQVAMNLITNAYHAVAPKGGVITIEICEKECSVSDLVNTDLESGAYALLTVSDNGRGIEPGIVEKIFDPYFTTKEQGKGTGLGLAVVYSIIKEYKGDIGVESEPGKGTRFCIYLPLVDEASPEEFKDVDEPLPMGTEHILLVDDELSVAQLEKKILERMGYVVSVHSSSIEALDAFKESPGAYDLVISDMTMPGMTGDLLAVEMLSVRPDIPFVICSGFSERLSRERAESIGIKEYLMKPVTRSQMGQMVRRVLDEAGAH